MEDVKGHALTLNLLGTYLRDAYGGDIRRRDRVKLEEASDEQGGHAFRVMDAYVSSMAPTPFHAWFHRMPSKTERELQEEGRRVLALLSLVGLFERPVTVDCLNALRQGEATTNSV